MSAGTADNGEEVEIGMVSQATVGLRAMTREYAMGGVHSRGVKPIIVWPDEQLIERLCVQPLFPEIGLGGLGGRSYNLQFGRIWRHPRRWTLETGSRRNHPAS